MTRILNGKRRYNENQRQEKILKLEKTNENGNSTDKFRDEKDVNKLDKM